MFSLFVIPLMWIILGVWQSFLFFPCAFSGPSPQHPLFQLTSLAWCHRMYSPPPDTPQGSQLPSWHLSWEVHEHLKLMSSTELVICFSFILYFRKWHYHLSVGQTRNLPIVLDFTFLAKGPSPASTVHSPPWGSSQIPSYHVWLLILHLTLGDAIKIMLPL